MAAAGVDEEDLGHGIREPQALVRALALGKALAVAAGLPEGVALGADTVVVLGDEVLGKPRDAADARSMLARLQGRTHRVFTGVALVDAASGRQADAAEETLVTMRPLTPAEIHAYVESREPMDKAGAYAIQGLGATLITRVEGCFYNVVGLPLARTAIMLRSFGIEVLGQGSHPHA